MPLWHGSTYIQERMRAIYNFTSVLRGMKMVSRQVLQGFMFLPMFQ